MTKWADNLFGMKNKLKFFKLLSYIFSILSLTGVNYSWAADSNEHISAKHNNDGVRYLKTNHYKEAISEFNEAIRINHNNSTFYYNRGLTKHRLALFQNAITDYNAVIDMETNSGIAGKAYCSRGLTKRSLGDYNGAIADYNHGLSLLPQIANSHLGLYFQGLIESKNGHPNKAIEYFNKAIALNSSDANYFHDRGLAEQKRGNKLAAKKDFDTEKKIHSK